MNGWTVLKRMLRYVRPYRGWVALAAVGMVGSQALAISIPVILGAVIDIGITSGDSGYMLAAGLLVVGLGVLRGVTGFLYRYFGERMSHHIAYDLRNEVYDKVQNQSFTYHDQAHTGTLVTRAISDVSEVQRFYAYGLLDGLNTLTLIGGVALIMIITSPLLALISLLPLIPLAFASKNFAVRVDPEWRKIMDEMQDLGNHLQENALGAEVVRAFARERYEVEKFAANNQRLYDDQLRLVNHWGRFLPGSAFIIAFSTALTLFFGAVMEQNNLGGVTVGLVVSFNAYILLVAMPVRFLGFVILLVTQGVSSARRVFEILDAPELVTEKPDALPLPQMQGIVRFEHVSLTYHNTLRPALRDVSLEAQPGTVTAVVGQTGAGKSSLVGLIPRFYDVSSGRVTIDGIDVRDLKLADLRGQIGIVLQQSLLFSATTRENIAYGKPDATMDEIIAAAEAANAHGFISEFPEGYDTVIGERGVTLSGGQKQRIAIARALLLNPRILVLDDATSSVDTKTELTIRDALKRLMAGRTTFIIAQRLNAVQDADQILFMKGGRITERGTHQELMALNGDYAAVYQLQLADQQRARAEIADFSRLRTEKRSTNELQSVIQRATGS